MTEKPPGIWGEAQGNHNSSRRSGTLAGGGSVWAGLGKVGRCREESFLWNRGSLDKGPETGAFEIFHSDKKLEIDHYQEAWECALLCTPAAIQPCHLQLVFFHCVLKPSFTSSTRLVKAQIAGSTLRVSDLGGDGLKILHFYQDRWVKLK